MQASNKSLSLVIPTHNRMESLRRALNSIQVQTLSSQLFDVVVVADGCVDGTVEMLKQYASPFTITVIEQNGQGAAAARNAGINAATGDILVLMDDDIEADPRFLEAHYAVHQKGNHYVVIGYLSTIVQNKKGFFFPTLKAWWEAMFYAMSHTGHRFHYKNLLTGNMSVSAHLFHAVGGFDNSFKCQEDYELGLRLLEAGAQFVYEPKALGYHHEITDLKRSLNRKQQEGIAAIQFLRKRPELIRTIHLLSHFTSKYPPYYKAMLFLLFNFPFIPQFLAGYNMQVLKLYEFFKMRGAWGKLLDKLLAYNYLKGVAKASGNEKTISGLIRSHAKFIEHSEGGVNIDLDAGIEQAEFILDTYRPLTLNIFIGKQPVGKAYTEIGTESFRGAHLRPLLASKFSGPIMQSLLFNKKILPQKSSVLN